MVECRPTGLQNADHFHGCILDNKQTNMIPKEKKCEEHFGRDLLKMTFEMIHSVVLLGYSRIS